MKFTLRFLLLPLLATAALGPTADAGEIRVMDFTDVGSTSKCIGKPTTPMCAVETFAACGIRSDWTFCRLVGFDPDVYRGRVLDDYARLYYFRYEFIGQGKLADADIPPARRRQGNKSWRARDVAIQLWWQGCPPIESCVRETQRHPTRKYGEGCRSFDRCGKATSPRTYLLRQHGKRWRVVADYGEPVLPADFWKRK